MSSSKDATQPRGEDAWKAAKQAIAKRNEAAWARGREERAARDAAVRNRQMARERAEFANLPTQPSEDAPSSD
jgi:hypothetical protein